MSDGLELRNVSINRASREIVHGVDLDVPAGEITTILGPNGAGKSTLAAAIAGLLPVAGGTITLDSKQLANRRPERVRAAGVSVVPEGRRLLPALTVKDNLRVATYSLGKQAAKDGLDYTLSLFPELEKRWEIGGRLLSGGEQQMVVLAQALVSRPKILVVDELSLGLAPIVVKRLAPVLADVAASGVGVLLIEQFAQVALAHATTAHVLEGGRFRHSGPAQEFIDNPDLLHAAYLLRSQAEFDQKADTALVTGDEVVATQGKNVLRGRRLFVDLTWLTQYPLAQNYVTSIRLLSPEGKQIVGVDQPPGYGFFPTISWQPGQPVYDRRQLNLPENLPPGSYALEIILYEKVTLREIGRTLVEGVKLGS